MSCKLKYEITFYPGSGLYYKITPQKAGWFVARRSMKNHTDFTRAKMRACRSGVSTFQLYHGGPKIIIERNR